MCSIKITYTYTLTYSEKNTNNNFKKSFYKGSIDLSDLYHSVLMPIFRGSCQIKHMLQFSLRIRDAITLNNDKCRHSLDLHNLAL